MVGLTRADIAAAEGAEGGYVDDPAQHAVSRSYEWLLAVINHLCGTHVAALN
jgi:hypothetical protein